MLHRNESLSGFHPRYIEAIGQIINPMTTPSHTFEHWLNHCSFISCNSHIWHVMTFSNSSSHNLFNSYWLWPVVLFCLQDENFCVSFSWLKNLVLVWGSDLLWNLKPSSAVSRLYLFVCLITPSRQALTSNLRGHEPTLLIRQWIEIVHIFLTQKLYLKQST